MPDMYSIPVTHPNKVVIDPLGLTKGELIAYYERLAGPVLQYAEGRPLSYKRYPKGFPGVHFFQRNCPQHAPEWMGIKELGVHKKARYILPSRIEDFLWLVNKEALEFHLVQTRPPHLMRPDFLVFDLDPPHQEGESLYANFKQVRDLALEIHPIIEGFGYHTFVKTSGKKGVHIYCPIVSEYSFDAVFAAAKEVGEAIVSQVKGVTLRIAKEERRGRTLIDIYRNHTLQSMAMPYGMRATAEGTVSMPLTWAQLEGIESPESFTVRTVSDYLQDHPDAWQSIREHPVPLHTDSQKN